MNVVTSNGFQAYYGNIIYICFYHLPVLSYLLLELLAMVTCTCVKLIVLLLEIVQEKLHNFLLFVEVALLQD